MNNYERNIVATFDRATDADIAVGVQWYREAHRVALRVGRGDANVGAGILAALSPQTSWKENVIRAVECTRTKRGRFTGGHIRVFLAKAEAIWRGEHPLSILNGTKELAFYVGILLQGEGQEVCIDRHAIAVCLGRQATAAERTLDNRTKRGRAQYAAYADAYRNVAAALPYSAQQLQAICWVTWRRESGITD